MSVILTGDCVACFYVPASSALIETLRDRMFKPSLSTIISETSR